MKPAGGANHSTPATQSKTVTDAVSGYDLSSVKPRQGRPKTRQPPSVRAREERARVWDQAPVEARQKPESHSVPVLGTSIDSTRLSEPVLSSEAMGIEIGAVVDRLSDAISSREFTTMDQAMDEMEAKGWRFNGSPLYFHESAWKFAHEAPCRLLRSFNDELPDAVLERVIRLLDLGCDPNSSDGDDMSMLMYACKINHPVLAKMLLLCPGINQHKLNWWGKNAAMIAHEQGSVQLFPLLNQAGISLHPANPAISIYEKMRSENNEVRYAELMKQLMEILAEDHYVSLRDDKGMTLLLRAIDDGELAVVDMLCKLEPAPNIQLRDADGKSAFDYAAGIHDDELRSDVLGFLHALRRDSLGTVRDLRKKKHNIARDSSKNA